MSIFKTGKLIKASASIDRSKEEGGQGDPERMTVGWGLTSAVEDSEM